MVLTCVYIFAFVFVLSLVIVVHEGGHFFVARRCGVKVEEFSLGFGKELWGRVDKKGTRWKICAIPLGGYVKMLGDMDAASAKSSIRNVPKKMQKYTFMAQKLWKRALIIFAGPAMNYVFAVLVMTVCFYFAGMGKFEPIIGEVMDDSPAKEAGLMVGDKFLTVNGQPIGDFSDVQRMTRITDFGKNLDIVFERDGKQLSVSLKPDYLDGSDYPLIGIRVDPNHFVEMDNISMWESFSTSVVQVYSMSRDTLKYLGQVIAGGRAPKEMRGPLGIAEASGDALQGGFWVLAIFIANISVAVGLMNLLPIPLLDGGHLFLYAIEAICRRPLPEKVQNSLMWMGASILMGLIAYTFFLDIPRLIERIMK